ncbi:MAG: BrnA antitoxin family protein [Spirochaetaceae bacterium]|nr:BrnA antitoxin family protein [Spirochaetaceae bacterium]
MPPLKPDHISPTGDENAAINAGIAADPDAFELDAEWFRNARPAIEVDPDLAAHLRDGSDSPRSARRERVTIILDADIAQHFRSTGSDWQARLNETLRRAVFGTGSRA